MKGLFITGTDTGVGKTVVSGIIISLLKPTGLSVGAMKPFETGCLKRDDLLIPSDGLFLKNVSHMDESLNHVTPFALEKPLAPMVAAHLDVIEIDIKKIWKIFNKLKERYDVIIVEGVGGIMVPIKRDYFVLDMARDFGFPVIVVSRPILGTINHTLLTVNYALEHGLDVRGVIINYSSPPQGDLAEETNPGVISELSSVPLLGVIPYIDRFDDESLRKTALKYLDVDAIKKIVGI